MNEALINAVAQSNVLILNGMANGIVAAIARGAARGRMPIWQVAKAYGEFQNIAATAQFGDPSQYLSGMNGLGQLLPQQPAQTVQPDITELLSKINDRLDALETSGQ